MANYYVNNPVDVVKVGQQVKVKVIGIDLEREKVSLSMKDDSAPQAPRREQGVLQEKKSSFTRNEDSSELILRGNITFS